MSYAVVIPAAGSGSRMGAPVPKVLLPLTASAHSAASDAACDSVLRRAVAVFDADSQCEVIVVCVPEAWRDQFALQLGSFRRVQLVIGGSTRQESVRNGIEFLARTGFPEDGTVLIHDAARCCVSSQVIARVLAGVVQHGAASAAVKIVDSLCRAEHGVVKGYVERDNLWAIQTPQGFRMADILGAHRHAEQHQISALDDAGLVAHLRPIYLVDGDRFNIKVTEPSDLPIAVNIVSHGVSCSE
jgi:2-C-methyl-D-erythritol 4-phosphate cytidylyltransferase